MSRFVRNLLIGLGAVYLTAQFVEEYRGWPVFAALGLYPSFHPFAFAWQWATSAFVERPGSMSIVSAALTIYVAATYFPSVESRYDRTTLIAAIASSIAGAGLLALPVAFLFPTPVPLAGLFTMVQGVFAFDLWNKRGSSMLFSFFPGSAAVHSFTAKEIAAILVGFVLIRFFIFPYLASLVYDLGALFGGWLYAYLRERRSAKRFVRHSFTVLKGGKSDKMLH